MIPAPISEDAVAAVAVIEAYYETELCTLILQRAARQGDPWSGHSAFPGGKKDPSDVNILDTCLRETQEETGILLTKQDLIRPLPANYAGRVANRLTLVQPFLFRLNVMPNLQLQQSEIHSSYWLPVTRFQDPNQHSIYTAVAGRAFPCVWLDQQPLWGFTYQVLKDLYCP